MAKLIPRIKVDDPEEISKLLKVLNGLGIRAELLMDKTGQRFIQLTSPKAGEYSNSNRESTNVSTSASHPPEKPGSESSSTSRHLMEHQPSINSHSQAPVFPCGIQQDYNRPTKEIQEMWRPRCQNCNEPMNIVHGDDDWVWWMCMKCGLTREVR